MKEITDDGYRRTAVRTKHKHVLNEKLGQFHDRGETTKVIESNGYYYIYVKMEKELDGRETKR